MNEASRKEISKELGFSDRIDVEGTKYYEYVKDFADTQQNCWEGVGGGEWGKGV